MLEIAIMTANERTIAYGTLGADTDTWFLSMREGILLLDVPFAFDGPRERKTVSVIGKMGVPSNSPRTKLIVEKIIGHEAVAKRAYEIYESDDSGAADDNWFRAEHELLGAQDKKNQTMVLTSFS
jgi:hypothetical protein